MAIGDICIAPNCETIIKWGGSLCSKHKERWKKYKSYDLPIKLKLPHDYLMSCIHCGQLTKEQIQFRKSRTMFSDVINQACKKCCKTSKKKRFQEYNELDSRICKKCGIEKEKINYSDFEWFRKSPWCLSCKRIKQNAINKIKQEKGQQTIYKRKTRLKTVFGITEEDYQIMLLNQNGVCAICKNPETTIISGKLIRLSIDHCHEAESKGVMKIRGLLCKSCNHGLGYFKDNINFLLIAIEYLKR